MKPSPTLIAAWMTFACVIPSLAPYVLPRILPLLQSRFPELQLELRETQTRQLIEDIKSGALDAAMLALPVAEPDIDTIALFEDLFLLAVPASDPRQETARVAADDIDQSRLILLEDGHCLRDQALDVCRLAGASERRNFRATSLETLRQMVAAGVGVTLLPQLAVSPKTVAVWWWVLKRVLCSTSTAAPQT